MVVYTCSSCGFRTVMVQCQMPGLHLQVYTCNPNGFREAVVQKLRTPCTTKLVPRQLEWKGDTMSQKTTKEPEPSL